MGYYYTKDAKLVIALISATLIGMATSYPGSVPNFPDVCSKMTPGIHEFFNNSCLYNDIHTMDKWIHLS